MERAAAVGLGRHDTHPGQHRRHGDGQRDDRRRRREPNAPGHAFALPDQLPRRRPHPKDRAEEKHDSAKPDPCHQRPNDDPEGPAAGRRVDRAHDHVDVLGGPTPDCNLSGRHLGMRTIDELRRRHRAARSPGIVEEGHVGEDHSLVGVGFHSRLIVADGMRADGHRLSRPERAFLLDVVGGAGESDEHEHHADVNDVASVASSSFGNQAQQRGEGPFAFSHSNPGAAPEFLTHAREDETTCREGESRCDRPGPREHGSRHGVVDLGRLDDGWVTEPCAEQELQDGDRGPNSERKQQSAGEVRACGLTPGDERSQSRKKEEDDSERHHPLVVEPGTDRNLLAAQPLAQKREGRGDQHEHHHSEQHPVVQQEGELAADE